MTVSIQYVAISVATPKRCRHMLHHRRLCCRRTHQVGAGNIVVPSIAGLYTSVTSHVSVQTIVTEQLLYHSVV